MSQNDKTAETANHTSAGVQSVSDPEAYNRSQRFKEIHKARQGVSNHLSEMDFGEEKGSYREDSAMRLAHLVAVYIIELEPLIIESDYDDVGNFPDELPHESLRHFASKLGLYNQQNDVPYPYISARVFSVANQFYARMGMDLDIQDREQITKIDDNLLKEVDEWRQNNIE